METINLARSENMSTIPMSLDQPLLKRLTRFLLWRAAEDYYDEIVIKPGTFYDEF